MCGIGGVWQGSGKRLVSRERLDACAYAMSHRGPDGGGMYYQGEIGLCNRRLAIIDVSSRGDQPMLVNCPLGKRKLRIVYNGEIYNYRELKVILEQLGHVFKSDSDTEVIVHAFEQWGTGSFPKLRGMFAYALWDEAEKTLFLVRDRFGIKPLYYAKQNGCLVFASEIRALKELAGSDFSVRSGAVYEFLRQGYLRQPKTFYRGVEMLPPGSFLQISASGVHLEKFFEVVSYYVREKSLYSFEEAVSQLKGVLQDTARHHMRADVPVGLFLSGGIDSTSLLVSLREQGFKNLHTVSAVFPGTVYDESSRIHSLVKQFETDHDDVPVSGQDFVIFLDRILEHMDQPSSDGVNTFFVSLAAKQAGLKVVLSGLGGDELFGGYPSFYDLPKIMALKGLLAGLGAAGGLWLAKQYGPLSGKIEKLEQIHQASSLRHAWRAYRSLFSASQISLLMPDCKPTADEIEADTAPGKSIRSAISYYELTDYMRNQLLRDSDVFSMAHSIELRVPFVDDFMAKFSIALPDAYKTSPSSHKRILREAIRPMVPRLILSAPKQGFVLPIEKWMKSEAKSIIQDELLETRIYNGQSAARLWNLFLADKVHWSRIWSLFVLNRFLKSL